MDVAGGQVVGPDGGGGLAGGEVDGDRHLAAGEVDQVAVLADAAVAADPNAVDGHGQLLRFELRVGGADGRQHAAPVRVVAVHGSLEQVAAGDGLGDLDGVVLGRGMDDFDGDVLGGAFGVAYELPGEAGAHGGHGGLELGRVRRDFGGAGGQQQDGVVGGHAAVGVDAVEGDPGRVAQNGVERFGLDDGVRGDDDEHRGQAGRQHPGALGHAADDV